MNESIAGLSSQQPGMESLYTPSRPDGAPPYPDILPSVLVVDDDDQYRRVLLNYLELIHYAGKGAADAPEALEILAQERVDLVVSDIRMKGMDGVALMQEAHQSYPQIPFIMMTGYALEYSYHETINAGASDFIVKPFSLGELRAKIWRIQKEKEILWHLQHSLARLKNLIENTEWPWSPPWNREIPIPPPPRSRRRPGLRHRPGNGAPGRADRGPAPGRLCPRYRQDGGSRR